MSFLLGLLLSGGAGSAIAGGVLFNELLAEGDPGTRLALRVRRRVRGVLSPGRVGRLVGTVESCHGASLVAPLSGRECVAYEVRAQTRARPRGRSLAERGVRAVPVQLEDVRARDFVLADEASKVRLYVRASRGARVFLVKDAVYHTGALDGRPTRAMHDFLERHEPGFRQAVFAAERASFHEGALFVGDRVAVVGQIVFDPAFDGGGGDASSGYRTAVERLGVGPLPRGGPLLVGNEPGALR